MKNTETILEFNKIKDKISEFAVSDDANFLCHNITQIKNENLLQESLKEVDTAYKTINLNKSPTFNKIANINEILARLKIKASLSIKELLNIKNLLESVESLIFYRKSEEFNSVLDKYFNKLTPLPYDKNNIEKVIISETEISDHASTILNAIRKKKILLNERKNQIGNKLINLYKDYLQELVITNKEGHNCLPVKSEFKNRINGTIYGVSGSESTIFIEPQEIINIQNEINENYSLEQIEINKILENLSNNLIPNINILEENYKNVIKLDFIYAKAKYAYNTKSTLPLISNDYINLIKARHPLIDKEKVVPLDLTLGKDFIALILTGPNTGGKTVSLKTVGLIELMGLSGLFIPALENSTIKFFDNIYVDIGDEQSIEQSLSTFSSHMTNIVEILKVATKYSLVLFDEICTGTDPVEGASLAIAILNKLINQGTFSITSTHYPELKKFALLNKKVINGAFEFNIETLKPTYKLIIGIPGKSNAFAISEKLGIDKYIIENAKKLLSTNDVKFEDIISGLSEDKEKIEKEKKEIEEYKKEIIELKEKIKRQEKGLNERADSIIRQAKEKAQRVLYDAKTLADDTIKKLKTDDLKDAIDTRSKIKKGLNEATESLIEKVKGPAKPLSAKKIKLGAKVKVLTLNAYGIVESLPDKDYNLFVRIGILKTNANLRDLELVAEDNINIDGTKIKRYNDNGTSKIKLEKSYTVNSEINLIGQTREEALLLLDKFIDDAYISHVPRLRVIHGRGGYILKNSVHDFLKKCKIVKEYKLADFNEGGDGVTIVTLI